MGNKTELDPRVVEYFNKGGKAITFVNLMADLDMTREEAEAQFAALKEKYDLPTETVIVYEPQIAALNERNLRKRAERRRLLLP